MASSESKTEVGSERAEELVFWGTARAQLSPSGDNGWPCITRSASGQFDCVQLTCCQTS